MAVDLISPHVTEIMGSRSGYPEISYRAIMHTEEKDIALTAIDSIEFTQDFNNDISDMVVINFDIGVGDYVFDIKPYLQNLMITLYKDVDGVRGKGVIYKAVSVADRVPYGDVNGDYNREDLNATGLMGGSFQLVHRLVEVLRAVKCDGIYRATTVKDVLYTEYGAMLKSILVDGVAPKIKVNISEPDNITKYKHIVIPTGTSLLDLPTFLQDTKYGVYNGDICVYLTLVGNDINLFINPLYSTLESSEELYFYHSGNPIHDSTEVTYTKIGDMTKIISCSEMTLVENRETEYMNNGHALTRSSFQKLINHNATITNDSIHFDKESHLDSSAGYIKDDGLTSERYYGHEANMFKHRSKMLKDGISILQVKWGYSDPSLLRPDIPTIFVFQKDGKLVRLKGIIQNTYSLYNGSTKTTSTIINLGVRRMKDVEENK